MEIRRKNFVTAMDLYVTTLSKKSLKKNVTTFLCFFKTFIQENGNREVSRQSKPMSLHKELKREERMSRQNKTMSQQKMAE